MGIYKNTYKKDLQAAFNSLQQVLVLVLVLCCFNDAWSQGGLSVMDDHALTV